MEWDIAAGQAILEALGGEVVHAETGEPLHYNKANLLNPFFIARTVAVKSLLS
jgi:3'(2'), 5'-bisphosphate nucleotidase